MIPWWLGLVLFIVGAMAGVFLLAIVSCKNEDDELNGGDND